MFIRIGFPPPHPPQKKNGKIVSANDKTIGFLMPTCHKTSGAEAIWICSCMAASHWWPAGGYADLLPPWISLIATANRYEANCSGMETNHGAEPVLATLSEMYFQVYHPIICLWEVDSSVTWIHCALKQLPLSCFHQLKCSFRVSLTILMTFDHILRIQCMVELICRTAQQLIRMVAN